MSDSFILEVGGGPADIDDGVYAATLVRLEPFTYEHVEGPRQLLRWTFTLDDYDDPVPVEGVSSCALGVKSKAYAWLTALLGPDRMLERPKLRPEVDLVGRECQVEIGHDEKGYAKVKTVLGRPKRKPRPVLSSPPADPEAA